MNTNRETERQMKHCLFPKCPNVQGGRGLCLNHYSVARYAVIRKLVSWDQLEKSGKAIPKRTKGNSDAANWFIAANGKGRK